MSRNTSQDVWEIDSLLDLIPKPCTTEQVKGPPPSKPPLPTAGMFFGATSNTESTIPKCAYYTERHFSASFHKVTDINARRDILRRKKRCFMCLKKEHLVDQCDKSCINYKLRHHQSICQARSPGEALNCHPPPPEEKSPQGEPETQVPNSETRVSTTNTETPTTQRTTSTSSSKESVLWMNEWINEDQNKSMTVRILFDGGSQISHITDNVRRRSFNQWNRIVSRSPSLVLTCKNHCFKSPTWTTG